eukprot:gene13688-biopygen12991
MLPHQCPEDDILGARPLRLHAAHTGHVNVPKSSPVVRRAPAPVLTGFGTERGQPFPPLRAGARTSCVSAGRTCWAGHDDGKQRAAAAEHRSDFGIQGGGGILSPNSSAVGSNALQNIADALGARVPSAVQAAPWYPPRHLGPLADWSWIR